MESSSGRTLALRRFGITALFILALSTSPLAAQSLTDSVQIHGFGGWAYAETDGNSYLMGTPDGSWDNADFALNITAEPMEKLSIVAQIRGEAVNGEDEFELDYAFAGWSFSDELELRIGRVKHPFGIYGEIYDVGTLRPFFYLPQGIYGPSGFTARAYNGAGLAGWHDWDSGWGLEYDLYFGQIEGDFEVVGLMTTVPENFLIPKMNVGFEVNNTIGGRLTVNTPVTGLSFGVSAYSGDDYTHLETTEPGLTKTVYLASASYLSKKWSVRAEWADMSRTPDFEAEGGYIEAAYKFNDHWQLAARYDKIDVSFPETDFSILPPFFMQLLTHEEATLGLNYWFRSNLVIRLSYSQIDGNGYAFVSTPEEILALLATGELDDRTDMVLFGAQFSF